MTRTTFASAIAVGLAFAGPAYAQMGPTADMEQVREKLGEAQIEERRDLGAKLLRGTTEDGATVFMLVSPRDLTTEEEVAVSADDLKQRFEDAGFTGIQEIEEAEFVVGDLDDDTSIIVMRGNDFSGPIATGTIPPGSPGTMPSAPGATPPPGGTLDTPTPGAPPRAQ